MTRTFIQAPQFTRAWDSYINDDEELRKIEIDIMQNPKKYPVIKGTGGLRKLRWKLGNKGKRSGVRICYIDFEEFCIVYLMLLYSKNEKEDLSDEEANKVKMYIDEVYKSLQKKKGDKQNGKNV